MPSLPPFSGFASGFLLLSALLFSASGLSAQNQETFPYEPEAFVKAFAKHLKDTKRPEIEEAADKLETLFEEGSLSYGMVDEMVEAAGIMVERRMGPQRYLLPFAQSAAALAGYGHGEAAFAQWAGFVDTLLAGSRSPNNKPLSTWLEFSVGFFRDNALYQSRARTWFVESEGYRLRLEDGKPCVFFPLVELYGSVTGDTINVQRARGTYYPGDELWVGTQGRIDWSRANLSPGNVFADFGEHRIDLSGSSIEIDSATLTYKPAIDKPMLGRLVDKLVVNNAPDKTDYPRFRSYVSDATFVELYPNVRYVGSFSIRGYKFQGYGGCGLVQHPGLQVPGLWRRKPRAPGVLQQQRPAGGQGKNPAKLHRRQGPHLLRPGGGHDLFRRGQHLPPEHQAAF
jgi:hypothetical protein